MKLTSHVIYQRERLHLMEKLNVDELRDDAISYQLVSFFLCKNNKGKKGTENCALLLWCLEKQHQQH